MIYEVILDSGETPNKCTIAPLAHRADFQLYPVKGALVLGPLRSTVLLHHEGVCLSDLTSKLAHVQGIAAVDCIWRRLDVILGRITRPLPVLAKIPDGFQTAYPRKSKHTSDPEGGLATIEAIFTAAALLGHWDATLLSQYYFGRKFVKLNRERFIELGVQAAAQPEFAPVLAPRPRHALQRRQDRGKRVR